MASGPFSKQAIYRSVLLNNNYSDTAIGGALTTSPASGSPPSQYQQTLPGDRILLSPSDAYAQCNNNVGNLYTGSYRYVASLNTSTSPPQRGHGAFWVDVTGANNYQNDALYQVQSDEAANFGVVQFAGVFINNMTKGNYWWIQEAGKASCAFRATLSGTGAVGCGVYLAAAGNNANNSDVGAFDVLVGANSAAIFQANSTTAYNTIDQMLNRYVGPALVAPSNNNISIVDIVMNRLLFRQ